jgi:hypothetical protein
MLASVLVGEEKDADDDEHGSYLGRPVLLQDEGELP